MSAFDPNSIAEPTATGSLRTDLIIAVALGGLGAVATVWFTAQGMELFNDSATYLSVAEHIVHGKGITAAAPYTNSQLSISSQVAAAGRLPMSGWPPGYPLILAAVMQFGGSAINAARVVSTIGAAIFAGGMFLGSRRVFALALPTSLALTVLATWGPNVAAVDFGGMSGRGVIAAETVFVPLSLVALLCGIVALRTTSRLWVLATIALIAASTLVRATGPVLGLVLLIGAIATRHDVPAAHRRRRVVIGLAFLGSGVITTILWAIGNQLVYNPSTSVRHLGFYGASGVSAITLQVVAGWFGVPWSASMLLTLLVAICLVAAPLVIVLHPRIRRRWWAGHETQSVALVIAAISIVVTIGIILATCVFLDRTLLPDARHLAPAQPLAYLLGASVLTRWLAKRRTVDGAARPTSVQQSGITSAVIAGCILTAVCTIPVHRPQSGLTGGATSDMAALQVLPRGTRIVTNAPDELWLVTGRSGLVLPPYRYFTTMRPNPNFATDLGRIAHLAEDQPLLVVTATNVAYPTSQALSILRDRYGLVEVAKCGQSMRIWAMSDSGGAEIGRRLALSTSRACQAPQPSPDSGS